MALTLRVARALFLVAVVAMLAIGCSSSGRSADTPRSTPSTSAESPAPPVAAPPPAGPVPCDPQAMLAVLSPRDKLAQLLMVGVEGDDDASAVVAQHHVGGIMIGSWTDLSMMGDPVRGIAATAQALPLAVSVDEEGGRVSRLSNLIGIQPSPRVLSQTKTPAQVHELALKRGQDMKKLGVTIDFAPVVDVTTESDDEVIGDRSFGSDPAKVAEYAGAYAKGLREAGVLPVLKHFPGHGHASGDSHQSGVVTPPVADLKANDLIPYRTLTTQAPVAVMVGHMQVPELTGSDPASLSPAAYGLLRSGEYGGPPFEGLVFTDDLSSMGAINQRYGVADAVLKSLQAGADVALWVTTKEVPAVLDRLEQARAAGELDMGRIDASVLRVAAAKGPSPSCTR
jgi:beta-N-acetylhexosaminidase